MKRTRQKKAKKMAKRDVKASSITMLVPDFNSFKQSDACLWHFEHLFSSIPIPSSNSKTSNTRTQVEDRTTFENALEPQNYMSVLDVQLFPQFNNNKKNKRTIRSTASIDVDKQQETTTDKQTDSSDTNKSNRADTVKSAFDSDVATHALLVPETQLAFVYQTYNIVVAIDISSSVLNTALNRESSGHCNRSTILHGVLLDEIRDALQQLIIPISLANFSGSKGNKNRNKNKNKKKSDNQKNTNDSTSTRTGTSSTKSSSSPLSSSSPPPLSSFATPIGFEPELLVTIATVGSSPDDMLRPILKSFRLVPHRLDEMMDEMIQRMVALIQHDTEKRKKEKNNRRGGSNGSGGSGSSGGSGGTDVASVLESCMLIHETMPKHGCPSILYVSDGVMMLPSAGSYDNIVLRLTRKSIACNTIRIRGADLGNTAWGCVSDPDTMAFLAHATGGAFFDLATEKTAVRIFRGRRKKHGHGNAAKDGNHQRQHQYNDQQQQPSRQPQQLQQSQQSHQPHQSHQSHQSEQQQQRQQRQQQQQHQHKQNQQADYFLTTLGQ